MAKKDSPAYRYVNTAGQNFLAFYLEDIILNFDRFENDPDYKREKINEYFENQNGFYDKKFGNTSSRVSAALSIIRDGLVREALTLIDGYSKAVLPESVKKAKNMMAKIDVGELVLP